MDPKFTAVIYARYSSHAQRDVSIEQQVRACTQFAQRHGIEIANIYEDRALTGTSDKRPGFQLMIHDAHTAAWDYVIVYTLDRFARDRYDSAVYKRQLKNMGVKVLSAMENISDDPTGILVESLLEGLAEYYSKELSRKVLRGHEDNARKCLVNGPLPLGYVKGEDRRYQIHPDEAAVVQEVFRRVGESEPFADIIRDLNRRGIRTKKGSQWNRSSFNSLLTNERYTGVYIYGDLRVPGGIPQIISQEQFDRVAAIIHRKPNARRDPSGRTPQRRRRDSGVYLLTGKLYCGHCKSPMIGVSGTSHTSAPHFYYTCKGRRDDHASCAKKNIRRDHIEFLIASALRDTMLTDQAICALAEATIAYQHQQSPDNPLDPLKAQLADVERSLGNLMKAIEAGIFSDTTKERLAELESQKRELSAQISVATAEAENALTREEIIATLEMFRDGDIHDPAYQEAMIDTFLVAAYVYDDSVKIVFNLGGDKKDVSLPLDITALPVPSEVRLTSPLGDQKEKVAQATFSFCPLHSSIFALHFSLKSTMGLFHRREKIKSLLLRYVKCLRT